MEHTVQQLTNLVFGQRNYPTSGRNSGQETPGFFLLQSNKVSFYWIRQSSIIFPWLNVRKSSPRRLFFLVSYQRPFNCVQNADFISSWAVSPFLLLMMHQSAWNKGTKYLSSPSEVAVQLLCHLCGFYLEALWMVVLWGCWECSAGGCPLRRTTVPRMP